ncbi:MAG: imidazole glycerol phosphate synthase subunit HisH [Candidatus Pacebacteria bacterium]|jgi:glutamine amidotransferase|nr:imidazole glycerol phosphate synthase subunit HisH [Candidatus Paceibacterota bacterium]
MKRNTTIAIIDYGLGNLYSLKKALGLFAETVIITSDPKIIAMADGIILPGVGAFQAGMREIEKRKLLEPIVRFSKTGKPMLGICLGAQIMLSKGFEFGEHQGLGLVRGNVKIFPKFVSDSEKIPNIGWSEVSPAKKTKWKNTIMNGISDKSSVYFVHSYIMIPDNKTEILSEATCGDITFCAGVKKGNIYGTQFHPEKSGEVGLKIIENFVTIANTYDKK